MSASAPRQHRAPAAAKPALDPIDEALRRLSREQVVSVLRQVCWNERELRWAIDNVTRDALQARWKADQAAATQAMETWFAAGARARETGRPADAIAYYEAEQANERAETREHASYARLMAHYDRAKAPA